MVEVLVVASVPSFGGAKIEVCLVSAAVIINHTSCCDYLNLWRGN